MKRLIFLIIGLVFILSENFGQVTANFNIPDTVCVNQVFNIQNTSTNGSTYYWNFCSGNLSNTPNGQNLGNLGNLVGPVYITLAKDNTSHYSFVTNHFSAGLTVNSYGNSFSNTPVSTDLGNLGIMNPKIEGIQVKNDNGHWYGLIAGGMQNYNMYRLDFGNSLANVPVAEDLGNISSVLNYPHSLYTWQENGNWYTLVGNNNTSTLVRLSFGNSLANTPTGVDLGNIGGLMNQPVGFFPIQENGSWYVFVVNRNNSTICRIDFGSSLLNNPTSGISIGNPQNTLQYPRSITILRDCGQTIAFVVNESPVDDIVRLTFPSGITSIPSGASLGNIAAFGFPHNISEIYREGDTLFALVANVGSSTISRLSFPTCTNALIPSSNLQNPPAISYNAPGTYNINLIVNEGLATQSVMCQQVYVGGIPSVTVNPASPGPFCHGILTDPITFTSPVGGTIFTWTNSNPAIGLPASGTGNIPAFTPVNSGSTNLSATITITPHASICTGTPVVIIISIRPTPTVNTVSNQTKCKGTNTSAISFSGSLTSTTYTWTNSTPAIGLAASGTGNIGAFATTNTTSAPLVATITVTPAKNGCSGTPITFTITVNPTPTLTAVTGQVICDHDSTALITLTGPVAGSTFTWTNTTSSIGLGSSGTGNIAVFQAINATTASVTSTITVVPHANGCNGSSSTFTIKVNPTPTVTTINNQTRCHGAATTAVSFTGPVTGSTFTWTNSDPTIGLAATGTGNIASFTPVNTTSAIIVATITVTPFANACDGTPKTFTFTINPKPVVNPITNQSACTGSLTTPIVFTSAISGSTFTWTNSTTSIGLGASGTGNIAAFSAANTSAVQVVATITLTPHAGGCNGTTSTFTYTVNPLPIVNTIPNQTFCNGSSTAAINFTGPLAGTTFSWTSSNPNIGLAANGNGNIASFTANNSGAAPITSTISVTPTSNACTGTIKTFTITINPTPAVNAITNQSICGGNLSNQVNFTSSVPGSTYTWTNNNTTIGIAASGTGNIAQFTTINNTNAIAIDTCHVTPNYGTCQGTVVNFVYSIIPQANVNTITNLSNCNSESAGPFNFTGTVTGTTFNWTNTNPTIGLAASGSGSIAAFTAVNTTASAITATITVTPSANSCNGQVMTFTITVTPTPAMGSMNNVTVCNGALIPAQIFTGLTNGTTFAWTNSVPTIGIAGTGTGNIPAFNAINTSDTVQIATITVTPHVNACSGSNKVYTITVKPSPKVDSVPNDTVCKGSLTNLISFTSGVAGTVFNWSNSMTFIGLPAYGMGDINAFVAANNTSSPMVGVITVTPVASGCIGPDMLFSISVIPIPTATAGGDIVVCLGDTAQLSAGGGGLYAWGPPLGLSAVNIPDPYVYPEVTTTYIVTVTVNGCTDTDTLKVTVNIKPIVDAGGNKTICIGDSVELVASGGDMYLWSNGENIDSTMVSPLITTMYYVTVTNENGCSNNDSVNVSVNPLPVIGITPANPHICADSSVNLSATGAASYQWFPIKGLSAGFGPTVIATPKFNSTYTVTGTSTEGCISTKSVDINVVLTPVVSLYDTGYICLGDVLVLNAGFNDSTFCIWSNGETTNRITINEPGLYWVAVGNDGCTVYDSIFIKSCTNIWIPSAFTPNSNGVNDIFSAKASTDLIRFNMNIYDRWGALMFSSENINEGWDGTKNGQECPAGVYVYVISWEGEGTDSHFRRNMEKGSVTLMR